MPDYTGKMSPDEIVTASRWLVQHQKDDLVCPICKTTAWTMEEYLVRISGYVPHTQIAMAAPVYPQFMLVCNTCGSTQLINAVFAGIVYPRGMKPSEASNG